MQRALHGPEIMVGVAAIPNVAATLVAAAKLCKVSAVVITNPTAGTITITLKSGDGATSYAVIPVATNTSYTWPPNGSTNFDGVFFTNGLQWVASATGAFGEVIGVKSN